MSLIPVPNESKIDTGKTKLVAIPPSLNKPEKDAKRKEVSLKEWHGLSVRKEE